MTKQMKISLVILGTLLALAAVFAVLNLQNLAGKKAAQQAQTFTILLGEQRAMVRMEDIEAVGVRDISANYKPSGKAPVTRVYQGVPFCEVAAYMQLDLSACKTVVFTAADGYSTAITAEEALDPALCAIVTACEGEPLGGKEDGGTGPFMMVLPQDQFSQRWCKFLLEVSAE